MCKFAQLYACHELFLNLIKNILFIFITELFRIKKKSKWILLVF